MRLTLTYLLFILLSTVYAQESIYNILPDTSCPSIEVYGEPELYVGDDLFNLINGGAELYHEYGFLEVLAAEIVIPATDPFKVEIFDMGSPEAAWGIYSMTATSNSVPFHAGVTGRSGEGFSQFIKGNYMVYMYYDQLDATDLQYTAGCMFSKIESSYPKPELMTAVDAAVEKAEKVVYYKGNLGLSSIYSFYYKDVFGYSEGAAAVYPELKIFLLKYEAEGECIEKYISAKDFFMNSSKYHDQLTLRGSFHMKDRKEQQIDCYFENTFLVIFIYSGEREVNEMREGIVGSMR